MPTSASDKAVLGALALLTVGSVGLKGATGTVPATAAATPAALERTVSTELRAQGFATRRQDYPNRSSAILATRGACRLLVRDASAGASDAAIFATDAARIGPVRYLYRGRVTAAPPDLALRLARFSAEVRQRVGLDSSVPAPLALASSPACGASNFGLDRRTVG